MRNKVAKTLRKFAEKQNLTKSSYKQLKRKWKALSHAEKHKQIEAVRLELSAQ